MLIAELLDLGVDAHTVHTIPHVGVASIPGVCAGQVTVNPVFTGILTYKKAEGVRAAALKQGLDTLMLETDAPYLAPVPHRGQPNRPAYLRHTAEYAAALFGVSFDELAAITTANSRKFFGI